MKERLWRHGFCLWHHQQNFVMWLRLYCRCDNATKVWLLAFLYERSYHNVNFARIWPEKPLFWGVVLFQITNFGLALGMALEFYTRVAQGLKLKVRTFCGLTHAFVEITREKLVGGSFLSPPPLSPILNRVKTTEISWKMDMCTIDRGVFKTRSNIFDEAFCENS